MGKGPNRRGSIYQDKHGQWWAQLPPDDMGRRPKRRAKSEQDAVLKLAELEKERERGANPGEKSPTVEQFLHTWLEVSVKPNVRATIYPDYALVVDHYIAPHIGRIRLNKLTTPQVQQMLNTLRASGLALGTVRLVRTRLRTALNTAIEWELLPPGKNVAKTAKLPATDDDEDTEIQTLTRSQVLTLLEAVYEHRLYVFYYTALATGARKGELIGLCWSAISFEKREITIRTQIQHIGREIHRTKPKTKKSNRTIPIDDELEGVLRTLWKMQLEEKRLLGTRWKEHTLVFPSEVGTPLHFTSIYRHLKLTLERAGLPNVRFHALRHTFATLALADGLPLADVSAILGHANPAITARLYLHPTDEGKRRAIETMGRLLRRSAR